MGERGARYMQAQDEQNNIKQWIGKEWKEKSNVKGKNFAAEKKVLANKNKKGSIDRRLSESDGAVVTFDV